MPKRRETHAQKAIKAEIANASSDKRRKQLEKKLADQVAKDEAGVRAGGDATRGRYNSQSGKPSARSKRPGWLPRKPSEKPPAEERSQWVTCQPRKWVRTPGRGTGWEDVQCPDCGGTGWRRA